MCAYPSAQEVSQGQIRPVWPVQPGPARNPTAQTAGLASAQPAILPCLPMNPSTTKSRTAVRLRGNDGRKRRRLGGARPCPAMAADLGAVDRGEPQEAKGGQKRQECDQIEGEREIADRDLGGTGDQRQQ